MKSIVRDIRLLSALGLAVLGTALLSPALRAAEGDYQKVIEYFRRKQNLPPDVTVEVAEVKDSPIQGAKTATLALSRGTQQQQIEILVSPDGRYVVFGEIEDVTKDPFAELAKKITTKDQPVRGPKDAKVTIVEFSDFQCPYCARAHSTVSNQVLKEYGDQVRLVYKNFPLGFHKWAEPAAIAGECVYDQNESAFWKVYDYYFEHQQELTPENVKEKTLEAVKDEKIDTAKFEQCLADEKTAAKVKADMQEGQEVGVSGTPAFIINGRMLSGAQPFERFKAIIDDELQRTGQKS